MSDVKIYHDKEKNVRYTTLSDNNNSYGDEIIELVYCSNCRHGHLMKNSGATYCDWWQYRVDENGWCYKGEPKGE